MPAVFKQLMRHKSIDTTMKYYVGQNAERTANEVWESYEANLRRAAGASLGAIGQEPTKSTD